MTLRKNYGDLPNVLDTHLQCCSVVEFGQKLKLSDRKKKERKKPEKRLKDVVFSYV